MIFNFLNCGILMIFIKLFLKKFLDILRNARLVDNITKFCYKVVKR